ncbi:UNVERIFIED_CONTAM: Nodulation receptor kinase [Sesamum latifolium]|uniref:non-specific serine/threonine protein kinase n=1 Tax=Sesamum latifolium TaxID=2727402 RepID=A0AAW2XCC2_9LAMI
MPLIYKWHGFSVSIFMIYVYMFFLINEENVSASQPAAAPDCILNAETLSLFGKIFLDLSEQRRCWGNEADVSGCGMQKLTAGLGGCSDFSTDDVHSKLRYKLERLKGKCGMSPADEWGDSCGSCLRSWEEIKKMHPDGRKSMEEDSEVYFEFEEQKQKKIGPGLYVLIGGVLGLLVVVIVSILIFSQRRKMPIAPVDKDAWRPVLSNFPAWRSALPAIPKESSILKVSIEEVCAAANNLSESNLIGEGTSGEASKPGCSGGYRVNENECFLIYELCPNGSLSEWLYGNDKVLSWIQRLEIAIGSAQGLSSEVRGTFGYVDPEYQSNQQVSAASDIYSFGVVLLQILSGRKVINMDMKKPKPLYKIAKSVMEKGSVAEFADPNLNGEYSVEAFGSIFELALLCIGHKRERPNIAQIIVKLEEALSISMRVKAPSPHATPDRSEKL